MPVERDRPLNARPPGSGANAAGAVQQVILYQSGLLVEDQHKLLMDSVAPQSDRLNDATYIKYVQLVGRFLRHLESKRLKWSNLAQNASDPQVDLEQVLLEATRQQKISKYTYVALNYAFGLSLTSASRR
jgi:hypothetical protein